MNYDVIKNLETCLPAVLEMLNNNLNLLYYSHIPVTVISLFLGLVVLIKGRHKILAKIFFILTLVFALWSILDLFTWLSDDTRVIMFTWSMIGLVEILFFLLTAYFVYVYIKKRDIPIYCKLIGSILLLPFLLMMSTTLNLSLFDIDYCYALENNVGLYYKYFVQGLSFFTIILFFIFSIRNIEKETKKQAKFLFIGTILFLISFFSAIFLGGYLIDKGIITGYGIEIYGLSGTLFFLIAITFLIVKFKAFNIKLLGAQALVWALIILVGAQFLYQADMPVSSLILTAITLIVSAIIGLLVVRSVKKVDHQRELLDIANKNQQSLLHFITHQVKGYLTKSRNIFDGMVSGDYDPISEKAHEAAKYGFDSDTKGVETVMAILRASDLKTGKTAFTKEKANISALVAEIVESRKDSAVQKGLEFTFEIEPNIETQVDQLQIKEVFKNLITNSILYTPKGTVHVVLKRESGKVKFSVVDTGVGLSSQDKAKLFTEGGKGEESSLVNVDSTGYGLYIARQIVQQHGGTIGAHSEGRGKGSEFFVLLPDIK